jgi:dTDP-4-dehydrorhamnose 3,5-epimerase
MRVLDTPVAGVLLVEPRIFSDERGFFMETWHAHGLAEAGIGGPFVQDNHSHSRRGTLRGLHYQCVKPQGKLVRVATGAVFDVVVDLRRSSRTFGKWYGVELSAANRLQLWIPAGFAHGFYVLSESADFLYKCTDYYAPQYERTLLWSDATVAVQWPLLPGAELLLSSKDAAGTRFGDVEVFE